MIGCRFEIRPSSVHEETEPGLSPEEVVAELAQRKAEDVAAGNPNSIVIGADTIVVCNGQILGKPADRQDARGTLEALSGRSHQVMTALTLVWKDRNRSESAIERTAVIFRQLSEPELDRYLDSDEPYDKAGAYGIQGRAALFTEKIDGCFYNVVGFPVTRFWLLLDQVTGGRAEDFRTGDDAPDLLAMDS